MKLISARPIAITGGCQSQCSNFHCSPLRDLTLLAECANHHHTRQIQRDRLKTCPWHLLGRPVQIAHLAGNPHP
jgi:hypothetical protein